MREEKAGNDKKGSRTCTAEAMHVKAPVHNLTFTLRENGRNQDREMEGHAEFNLEWQNDVKTLIIECL